MPYIRPTQNRFRSIIFFTVYRMLLWRYLKIISVILFFYMNCSCYEEGIGHYYTIITTILQLLPTISFSKIERVSMRLGLEIGRPSSCTSLQYCSVQQTSKNVRLCCNTDMFLMPIRGASKSKTTEECVGCCFFSENVLSCALFISVH